MTRRLALVVVPVLALTIAPPALADWQASGTFQYQDRDWDREGFTGTLTTKPVRFADVQAIDVNLSGNQAILASGKTDANGAFSITVRDTRTRTVAVRLLASTTQTSDLYVRVVDRSHADGTGDVYAVQTPPQANHGATAPLPVGTVVIPPFGAGEAFNMLDLGIYGADFIKSLTGSRPSSNKLVTFHWQLANSPAGPIGGSSAFLNDLTIRDAGGYDDPPILHEWAHYIMTWNYSRSTTTADPHALEDCAEDIGLAFDEGRASAFGAFVRRHFGMPLANWYIRTSGADGPGHLLNAYNLETDTEYSCPGDESEVTVSRILWDIGDTPATTDDTPGMDDDPPDALVLPDVETWQVFNGPIKSSNGTVSLELFWDGWFEIANGSYTAMKDLFSWWQIEFFPDANEPNNTAATATVVVPDGEHVHNTYFHDPDGDGDGQADTDYFKFTAVVGAPYTIRTDYLLSDANTKLELLGTNGTTVLATSDNQSPEDPSSSITWTFAQGGVYYVRSTHATDRGIYGSYDLVVEAPPCGDTPCGAQFCNVGGNISGMCEGSGVGCSGNIDSGWNTCVEHPVSYTLPAPKGGTTHNILWSCPAGQHVHLQVCPCQCLNDSCGTHYVIRGCEP